MVTCKLTWRSRSSPFKGKRHLFSFLSFCFLYFCLFLFYCFVFSFCLFLSFYMSFNLFCLFASAVTWNDIDKLNVFFLFLSLFYLSFSVSLFHLSVFAQFWYRLNKWIDDKKKLKRQTEANYLGYFSLTIKFRFCLHKSTPLMHSWNFKVKKKS